MDDVIARDVARRMEEEGSRSAPPESYPGVPDLPIARYTDPEFYRLEVNGVLRHTWLFAGHTSDWPDVGSYRTLSNPVVPIVLVRSDDGVLRAFLNSCRHRGAPVVRSESGTAPKLVCQFHSWGYDLFGCLKGVPDRRDFLDLDPERRGLLQIRCETWGDMVFVTESDDLPSIVEWLGPIDHVYGDLARTSRLRRVSTSTYEQECNWKVLVDAFLETYHVNTVHRDTLRTFLDTRRTVINLFPNGHAGMHIPYRDNADPGVWVTDLPHMDVHDSYRDTVMSFGIFPNLVMGTETDTGFFFIQWWPLSVNRTRMEVTWFGVDWGPGERPAGWDVKLLGSEMLMQEDLRNIEAIQRSLEAVAQEGMPLNYQERRIWQFHSELDRVIGRDRVPAELRVRELPDRLLYRMPASSL